MTFSGFLLTIEVGLAGSLGALARYLLSRFVAERISKEFPLLQYPKSGSLALLCSHRIQPLLVYIRKPKRSTGFSPGTLIINVTGSFAIGLLFALAARNIITSTLQLILATGFLGGYTTFSTMSWEIVQLARGGSRGASALYVGGSVVLGLLAAALGLLAGGRL